VTKAKVETSSPRRSRARRGEGDRLREQILEAAEHLLIQTGNEEAVTIRAVAEAVGVTPPSVYLHFADKDDLLFAICERHFARLAQVMQTPPGSGIWSSTSRSVWMRVSSKGTHSWCRSGSGRECTE
jgi:AcrR family transcriptional regulator